MITVDPAEDYIFDHWSGDLAGSENQITITMDSQKYVTANLRFDYNGDDIYVDADANGLNNGSSWDDAFVDHDVQQAPDLLGVGGVEVFGHPQIPCLGPGQ